MRPVALLIAPFLTATEVERGLAFRAKRHLLDLGWCPVFLPDALKDALFDGDPHERQIALECSQGFVATIARDLRNAAFQVGARVTEGMEKDIADWAIERALAVSAVRPKLVELGLTPPPTNVRPLTWTVQDAAR